MLSNQPKDLVLLSNEWNVQGVPQCLLIFD